MSSSEAFLNNLIRLTLMYIDSGKTVDNKLRAIRDCVKEGVAISPDNIKLISDIQYDLKVRASKSPFWPKARRYNQLWEIVKPKQPGRLFMSKNINLM